MYLRCISLVCSMWHLLLHRAPGKTFLRDHPYNATSVLQLLKRSLFPGNLSCASTHVNQEMQKSPEAIYNEGNSCSLTSEGIYYKLFQLKEINLTLSTTSLVIFCFMIYPLAYFLHYSVIILAGFKAHCSTPVETSFDKDFL